MLGTLVKTTRDDQPCCPEKVNRAMHKLKEINPLMQTHHSIAETLLTYFGSNGIITQANQDAHGKSMNHHMGV